MKVVQLFGDYDGVIALIMEKYGADETLHANCIESAKDFGRHGFKLVFIDTYDTTGWARSQLVGCTYEWVVLVS